MGIMKRLTTILMLLCASCFANDLQSIAKQDAHRDVRNEHTAFYGMLSGCLLGIFAMPVAYFKSDPIPIERFAGKSPTYIETYTQTYKTFKRERRIHGAFVGCSVNTFILTNACILPALGFKSVRSRGHIRF